jgi:ABC-type antimicrobial peptide transport system permease subunit
MSISSIFSLIFKKLSVKTGKALFLIIPVALLTAIALVLFSQASNFQKATADAVFGTIATQSTVLQITKTQTQDGGGFGGGGGRGGQDTLFTTEDIATVKSIPNVTSSAINYTLPINSIKAKNLVEKSEVDMSSLTVATPGIGALYTTEKFEYIDGQTIPIILNAASMTEVYEDWGGKTSITIARPQRPQPGQGGQTPAQRQAMRDLLPFKNQALSQTKDQLMGKEFDIEFGGLDKIPTFNNSVDADNITYTKLSDVDIQAKENARKDTISKYWDYAKVATPLSYKFKVVGYIKSDSKRSMYIPELFAEKLMSRLIANQEGARNTTPIPVTDLGTQYRGITYNGITLNTTQGNANRGIQGLPGGVGRPDQAPATTTTVAPIVAYTIPGLVIQSDANTNNIIDVYKDAEVFSKASKTSQNLTVKFDDLKNKEQVIKDLNSKGFTYVDTSNSGVFKTIESTISNILNYTPIAFGSLIAAVLGLNMAKIVAEGKKEIGIMRALGFTKGNIVSLFGLQGIVYTLIGSIVGLIIGIVGNLIISNLSYSKFQELVGKTVTESFGVKPNISLGQFQIFDFGNASKLGLVLLILTILVSLFFSFRASTISPVEAIKAE